MRAREQDTYVVFTEHEGGYMRVIRATETDYDRWKKNRVIDYWGDVDPNALGAVPYRVYPYWICLVRAEDGFDYGAEAARHAWTRELIAAMAPLPDPPKTRIVRDAGLAHFMPVDE